MARAKSRGVVKLRQAVNGQRGMEVILKPGVEFVSLSDIDKRRLWGLAVLGWRLKRARTAESNANASAEFLKAIIINLVTNRLPAGIAGVVTKRGPRSSMHVELVPNVGREVKDVLAMLRLLKGRKVDVVKSFGFDAAQLLGDADKFELLLAALSDIYGNEALGSVLTLDLKWAEFDKAVEAKKLPQKAATLVGPSMSSSIRVDAKPTA